MRFADINRRKIAQRARRDAEKESLPPRPGPDLPRHGERIGRIVIEYHGQRVEAVILQAGGRCRTHGVSIDGGPVETMGLYRACAAVSAKLGRMPSTRSDAWK